MYCKCTVNRHVLNQLSIVGIMAVELPGLGSWTVQRLKLRQAHMSGCSEQVHTAAVAQPGLLLCSILHCMSVLA